MSTATASPRAAFDAALLERIIASSSLPSWANDARRAAFDRFVALGLPDRRDENWMRTDVRLFKPQAWGLSGAPAAATAPEGLLAPAILSGDLAADSYADFERMQSPGSAAAAVAAGKLAGRLASVDGHVVRHELDSALVAKGVAFGPADELLASHADALRPHWFRVIDAGCDWFAAAHAAFHAASTVLYVPPGVRIADPLHVIAGISEGGVDTSHVLVVLGEGAEATVLTETAGGGVAGTAGGFHCGGTEIVVGKGAFLRMVNLQNWNTGVWHFARQKAVVHGDGRLQWTLGALGSRLSQVAQDVALAGRGASAQVNGVMFTEGRQHLVYNTLQHHEAPSCTSDLLYKGALQGKSRLVWRGMIKVDKAAQKTDGYQRNDNLMLSTEARADSIPGLEIEADDVRCTHGATSGRVDAEQIFYARARGLSADEAARLVVAGFFQQVFDRITIPQVREALARAIGGRIHRIA
ncbi:MAG: Fe-S cluster assembly protein SufD [Planctomycetes bacterium]|nr:Fe-S cluster assembly protein SufD [Planctomycetota bacterium]